ncbi:MAG TPA: RNA polymerase factor sigma-54 [Acidobacteriota bacterium]|nr:RNA polymerase factor sigma-54 [Acidobacteriota bacterium]
MSKYQLRPSLNVALSQRLAMTPSLLQKIELLTLNQLELSEMMTQELIKNPFLEEVPEGGDLDGNRDGTQEQEAAEKKDEKLDDFDYEYFFGEYLAPSYQVREYEPAENRPTFEVFLSSIGSLIDHLNWQLNLLEISETVQEIADYIVGNINEDGYLRISVEEIAGSLGVDEEEVETALEIVQALDPLGVGARDLQECLLLQIRGLGLQDTLAEKLVEEHLTLIEKKKYKEITRLAGCELSEIGEALKTLRRLSPRPGQQYNKKEPIYIRPDVYIYKVDGEYQIVMNDDGLPQLRLNRAYRRLLLEGSNVSKDTKSYIKERFRSALELIRSIDQRQQTIFRVCRAIVERQGEFLEKGRLHLKPMLIKDIATELEVHPSTISRVVANKYSHTPQGVIELRRFFTVGVESSNGENVSTVHVKERIRKIIEVEDVEKPLSDQRISKLLSSEGIHITRRTVAKYRDQMRVPGSRERKTTLLQ